MGDGGDGGLWFLRRFRFRLVALSCACMLSMFATPDPSDTVYPVRHALDDDLGWGDGPLRYDYVFVFMGRGVVEAVRVHTIPILLLAS